MTEHPFKRLLGTIKRRMKEADDKLSFTEMLYDAGKVEYAYDEALRLADRLERAVIYARELPACTGNRYARDDIMRDHDNFEVNAVADIVAVYMLYDDSPKYCNHYYCSAKGDKLRTEVYVVPQDEYFNWFECEKTMPEEGVKLYETIRDGGEV